MTTPFTPFGINYGTAAQVQAYSGRADLPAQPVWATDTNQLWIVDGTTGKYEIAKISDLAPYLKSADAAKTYLTQANASSTYLSKADASKTYMTITTANSSFATKAEVQSVKDDILEALRQVNAA